MYNNEGESLVKRLECGPVSISGEMLVSVHAESWERSTNWLCGVARIAESRSLRLWSRRMDGSSLFLIFIAFSNIPQCLYTVRLFPARPSVKKIPGGHRGQVFGVTILSLALCAIPVYWKDEKQGHDLFSQEKPEAVKANEEKLQRQHFKRNQEQQQQ